jgi:hypothetical protein
VHGGALHDLVAHGVNASGEDVYTATFTPDADNAEVGSVQVNPSSYTDAAGNAGSASNVVGFSGDTLAPTVAVAVNPGTVLAGQTSVVTFTFSEAVTGFALGDASVSGGVLDHLFHVGVNGSGQDVYTATFTPDINDVVAGSIRVSASSYSDAAGNLGSASNTVVIAGDTVSPTVAVTADHTALVAGDTALVTFTFSEAVAGFALGDVSLAGGALDHLIHVGVNGAGRDIYTATFTPDARDSEAGSVRVRASSYTDVAGNAGAASNTVGFSGDTLAPGVSVVAAPSTLLAGQTSLVTFTFSEAVNGFTPDDITVHGGTLGGLIHVGVNGGGQDVYTAIFTPDAGDSEAGSVQVGASSYIDAAGIAGSGSSIAAIGGDTLAPTVSVAADRLTLMAGQTAHLTFTFSEQNPAFALDDVTVHGGTLDHLVHAGLNASGQDIYTAMFTPDVTDDISGASSVQVNSSVYADAAGNRNAASNVIGFTGDTRAPAAPTLALHQDTGVSGADHVTRNPLIDTIKSDAADSLQYRIDGAASFSNDAPGAFTDGVHTVSVQGVDAAGNVSAVSSLTFTLDTVAPHLAGISATPSSGFATSGSIVQLTLGFSEAVNVSGGAPTLTLNDGGKAIYDAAATALLGDSSKIVFDHVVSASDHTAALAVTGFVADGAAVSDIAGNAADLSTVSAAFDALHINEATAPAYTIGGITRPELHFNASGHIIMDAAASAFAGQYGIEYLYLGLPAGTPYPPADIHV